MSTLADVLGVIETGDLLAELDRRGGRGLRDVSGEALVAELRRRNLAGSDEDPAEAVVEVGGLRVDALGRCATWRGRTVRLSPRETQVLYALALARWQGVRAVRYDRLAVRVWRGAEPGDIDNLRQYVGCLRKKLPGLIVTYRGSAAWVGAFGIDPDAESRVA